MLYKDVGGKFHRRDSSSNDTERLYACSGKDVRPKKSQQCEGIISLRVDNIEGEIIETKELIGYKVHSAW